VGLQGDGDGGPGGRDWSQPAEPIGLG
jgi:hypothetical protein